MKLIRKLKKKKELELKINKENKIKAALVRMIGEFSI